MIAKLKGVIDSLGEDWAVIDVAGVGYLIFCSARTLRELPVEGGAATVLIETHVREDHIHLYGFIDAVERDWFKLLQDVQGVGARVALGILSVLSPTDLAQSILAQDTTSLTRASGVGAKLAARIVNELRDKVANLAVFPGPAGASGDSAATRAGFAGPAANDAISALVNLGYRPAEALGAVTAAAGRHGGEPPVDELIRDSLRELSR